VGIAVRIALISVLSFCAITGLPIVIQIGNCSSGFSLISSSLNERLSFGRFYRPMALFRWCVCKDFTDRPHFLPTDNLQLFFY
jgi:hypothetical protein